MKFLVPVINNSHTSKNDMSGAEKISQYVVELMKNLFRKLAKYRPWARRVYINAQK